MRCEMVSWGRVERLARDLALRVRRDGFEPGLIVAIGRGGWVPGRLLSDYLDVGNLTEVKVEHYTATHKQSEARVRYGLSADPTGQRILLVDDVTDTGESFEAALEHIRAKGEPAALRTLALHHKRVSPYEPDYYGARIDRWRWIIYPWAVVEDFTALLGDMADRPEGPEAIAARLNADHGLRVSARMVRGLLPFIP